MFLLWSNNVTKTDILWFVHEVFEFCKEDLSEGLDEIRADYERLRLEEYEMGDEDEEEEEESDGDYDNMIKEN